MSSWKTDFSDAKFPTAYWFIVQTAEGRPVAIGGLQSINYVHGDAVHPDPRLQGGARRGPRTLHLDPHARHGLRPAAVAARHHLFAPTIRAPRV